MGHKITEQYNSSVYVVYILSCCARCVCFSFITLHIFKLNVGVKHACFIPVLYFFRRPNVMKQKNAFPPNFIHSLDSSHMMLTSLFCEREGITFVSVHDCFWTHPNSVDTMNKV